MGLLGHKAVPFLSFWGNSILLSIVAAPVCIPTNSEPGFPFLRILAKTCLLIYWWWSFWQGQDIFLDAKEVQTAFKINLKTLHLFLMCRKSPEFLAWDLGSEKKNNNKVSMATLNLSIKGKRAGSRGGSSPVFSLEVLPRFFFIGWFILSKF